MPNSKKQRSTNRPNTSRAVQRRVTAPIARASMIRRKSASMHSSNGGFRVKNSELVTKIESDVNVVNQTSILTKSINPGLSGVFPWLAQIASRYEKYSFHKLNFRYVARCPTTSSGDVSMAMEFNTLQAPPVNIQQMSSYKGFVNTPVWKEVSLPVQRADMNSSFKTHFVRFGNITGDRRLYDIGDLTVIMSTLNNYASGFAGGYLYVDYDVEFFIPQLSRDNGNFFSQNTQGTCKLGNVLQDERLDMQTQGQLVYADVQDPDRFTKNGIMRRRVRTPGYVGSNNPETYVYILPKGRWSVTGQSILTVGMSGVAGGWTGLEGIVGMFNFGGQQFPIDPTVTFPNLDNSAIRAFYASENLDVNQNYEFGGAVDNVIYVPNDPTEPADSTYIDAAKLWLTLRISSLPFIS